ncbi:STAS domain-containing protein [Pseudomonas leptonychotis]|jgi:anti-anti-sigma regulatory factor|uniref:STAS domain-containing protein n=1 Tax=Pseudomonas leptonychotis TaxID=2448482 RepID=A0A4T1ZYA7_9PSED|nr:STAS domain-containing protein [Pseudomonas leptonychotis]TIH08629.1 STAS domain-containing protein [Pseudomonas leptonychotis]
MFQLSHDPSCQPAQMRLGGSLTIYEVAAAHAELLQLLGEHPDHSWQLDLAELEELDTAGAQLLLAVLHHLEQAAATLQVCNASGAVLELLELLRLQALYPAVMPANR